MALFDDFYDNLEEYEHKGSNAEKQVLDAKLPGIVQSITSLLMKITVSNARALMGLYPNSSINFVSQEEE
jgi:hypothetical protein